MPGSGAAVVAEPQPQSSSNSGQRCQHLADLPPADDLLALILTLLQTHAVAAAAVASRTLVLGLFRSTCTAGALQSTPGGASSGKPSCCRNLKRTGQVTSHPQHVPLLISKTTLPPHASKLNIKGRNAGRRDGRAEHWGALLHAG
jgi:hypothetical protein